MIIIGYPGIGKSTLTENSTGYIDLESSDFKRELGEDWVKYYCSAACALSNDGYVVFVSSHKVVRNYLLENYNTKQLLAIVPSDKYYDEWLERIRNRYIIDPVEKNKNAFERVAKYWQTDLKDIYLDPIPVYTIFDLMYNLSDIIKWVVRERPGYKAHLIYENKDLFKPGTINIMKDGIWYKVGNYYCFKEDKNYVF